MPTYGGGPNPPVRLDKWQNIINVSWNLNISELSIISLYQAAGTQIVSGYFDFCARMDFFQAQQRWGGGSEEISPTYNGVIGPFWGFTPTPISCRAENREGYHRLDSVADNTSDFELPLLTYSGTDENGNPKCISMNRWDGSPANDNYASLDPNDIGRMFLWYCGDPDVASNAPARYTTFIVNNEHVSRYFFSNTGYPRRGGGLGQNKGQPNFTVQLIAFPTSGSGGHDNFRIRVANVSTGKDPTIQSQLQFGPNNEVQLTNARFTGYTDMEFADGNYLDWFSGGLYSFDRTDVYILNNIEEWQNGPRNTPW